MAKTRPGCSCPHQDASQPLQGTP